jgi:hypothetical protein
MLNEAHVTPGQRAMPLRVFLVRARHEGCGGQALTAELLTGSEGVSSRPVRRIVLRGTAANYKGEGGCGRIEERPARHSSNAPAPFA